MSTFPTISDEFELDDECGGGDDFLFIEICGQVVRKQLLSVVAMRCRGSRVEA